RAGEQGRGFAVVADEVRSLAQRTQNSTTEIEALIQALQKGTGAASGLMDASLQRTEGTVVLARQAEQALVEINQSIGTIEQMSQQISAAAEQQSAVTEEINRSVLSVRRHRRSVGFSHRAKRSIDRRAGPSGQRFAEHGRAFQDLTCARLC
ncbi:histidine kinase, HAMP region: chemotaxis sensory transducer, partial [Pseudomonas syringae pv. japonica str. M301072]